jgi:hypothetical protein
VRGEAIHIAIYPSVEVGPGWILAKSFGRSNCESVVGPIMTWSTNKDSRPSWRLGTSIRCIRPSNEVQSVPWRALTSLCSRNDARVGRSLRPLGPQGSLARSSIALIRASRRAWFLDLLLPYPQLRHRPCIAVERLSPNSVAPVTLGRFALPVLVQKPMCGSKFSLCTNVFHSITIVVDHA